MVGTTYSLFLLHGDSWFISIRPGRYESRIVLHHTRTSRLRDPEWYAVGAVLPMTWTGTNPARVPDARARSVPQEFSGHSSSARQSAHLVNTSPGGDLRQMAESLRRALVAFLTVAVVAVLPRPARCSPRAAALPIRHEDEIEQCHDDRDQAYGNRERSKRVGGEEKNAAQRLPRA